MIYYLGAQVGQIQDMYCVDNLHAKNGFYICQELH